MTPLEQARAILGEYYKNYVVIVQDYDNPTSYDVTFSDPYAAMGLLDCANNYHQTYLNVESNLVEEEWVWEDDDGEED
jgi:hypothetical protein